MECPLGLDVGLVDARPGSMGVVRLELRVEVDLAVLRVRVAMQAFATARVAREGANLKGDRLPHRQTADPHAVFVVVECVRFTVEENLRHLARNVNECTVLVRRHRQGRRDGIGGVRGVLGVSYIDHDVDGGDVKMGSAMGSFVACQNLHDPYPTVSPPVCVARAAVATN